VVDKPGGGAALIMEYVEIGGGLHKHAALLGEQLGRYMVLKASYG